MGINIKGSGKKKSQKKETDPKEKLERDLKSCMQCKFFFGNNNRCIKNKECSGRITDEQKAAQEEKKKSKCYGCPYGRNSTYCFPCIKDLMGKKES